MKAINYAAARTFLRCARGMPAGTRFVPLCAAPLGDRRIGDQRRLFSNDAANKNYYEILGISASASDSELAKKYHPDVCKEKDASKKFQEVSEAYEVLSDKSKRGEYDAFRSGGFRQGFDNRGMGGGGPQGFNFHSHRNAKDMFEEIFGRNFHFGESADGFGTTQEMSVRISFEEAARGVQKRINLNVIDSCLTCRGSGVKLGHTKVSCPYCNGTGMVTKNMSGFYMQSTCGHCRGQGMFNKDPCLDCEGTGSVVQNRSTDIYIPPGIDNEQTLRMQVGASTVYVHVQVTPSLIHRRVRENIFTDIEIGISEAVLGSTVKVPGIDADTTVRIPAGTSSHTQLCLKGKGLKRLNNVGSGDQFINVKIRVPKTITPKQRELMLEWHLMEHGGSPSGSTQEKKKADPPKGAEAEGAARPLTVVKMGKKQHQSDKLYMTTREWQAVGGYKDSADTRIQRAVFKRLPFSHCSLTFVPFKEPVCSPEGVIFDKKAITKYVQKHGINPVNGKKLTLDQLIDLKFSKDGDGNFQCPVTYRTFTPSSLIVVIRNTGNVYSMEAVEELNLKRRHMKDLLNDVPFQRKDIITLQDPNDLEKFNMEKFYHVQFDTRTLEEIADEKRQMAHPSYVLNKVTGEAKQALSKLNAKYVDTDKKKEEEHLVPDRVNAAHYSQGKMAAGLTSTVMEPITFNNAAILDEDTVKYGRVTKNGYVRMITNHGPINLELFCKVAPRACENFIVHCQNRIQGGDPTGTGKNGESIWKKNFKDEISTTLKHDARGHLDGKHTIFGKMVGGGDTLSAIEKVPTNEKTDEPLEPVIFMSAEVFVNPFEEAEEAIAKERAELAAQGKPLTAPTLRGQADAPAAPKMKAYGSGVGKFIKPELKVALKRVAEKGLADVAEPSTKTVRRPFSDFSDW
ncbi:RING-type E3 ubiquitin transferase [Aphelenchoides fujianensis]|nr:RING-type E3 ubiquitin transferase [Aphelenchoides fujianensis]